MPPAPAAHESAAGPPQPPLLCSEKFTMSFAKKRKTSEIWNFFKEVDTNFASCNICKTKLSYKTSTSNLKKHMLSKYPTVELSVSRIHQIRTRNCISRTFPLSTVMMKNPHHCQMCGISHSATSSQSPISSLSAGILQQDLSTSMNTNQSIKATQKKQTSLTTFSTFNKITNRSKEVIDQKLLMLFVKDFQPLSIVEDCGFKHFIYALNPANRYRGRPYLGLYFQHCMKNAYVILGKLLNLVNPSA
ncbi:hypothetical protein J437_LFUL015792 [Ladona fulva]|uniref:BED-type domain-containing protein n=1 Tax=Ladona fulva TaxID=123851 RepID=A0A8K0P9D5_LADFU|nr:hypothetical protein J437_LFUL015792 [Ladona fulva]